MAELDRVAKEIAAAGIKAVMMFGVSRRKDDTGSDSWNPDGLLARMTKRIKDAAPELLAISDTCFCEYTSHGHCGLLDGHDVAAIFHHTQHARVASLVDADGTQLALGHVPAA